MSGSSSVAATSPSTSASTTPSTSSDAPTTSTGSAATTTDRTSADIASATTSTAGSGDVTTRITEWRLSPTEIQSDLDRSVTIVRTKDSLVGAPTGASDDTVLIAMVKGKLQADSQASSAKIDVEAKNGEVTLKGTADSADQIGRAIALALDTQGVSKVSSDIKVNAATK